MAYPEPFKLEKEKLAMLLFAIICYFILWVIFSLVVPVRGGPDPFAPMIVSLLFVMLLDYSTQKLRWQLSKWAAECSKCCDIFITLCSIVMISFWSAGGVAATQNVHPEQRLLVIPLTFLYAFLYYCRNSAKCALREKDLPLSLNHPHNRHSCKTISTIGAILLATICVASYYVIASDPLIPLPVSLLAVGSLHILFMDLVDNLRPLLVRFNGIFRIVINLLILIITITQVRTSIFANPENISMSFTLVLSVITFTLLILNHQVTYMKDEEDEKIKASEAARSLEAGQWYLGDDTEKQQLIYTIEEVDELAKSGH